MSRSLTLALADVALGNLVALVCVAVLRLGRLADFVLLHRAIVRLTRKLPGERPMPESIRSWCLKPSMRICVGILEARAIDATVAIGEA